MKEFRFTEEAMVKILRAADEISMAEAAKIYTRRERFGKLERSM
jgi:hypothetical protein